MIGGSIWMNLICKKIHFSPLNTHFSYAISDRRCVVSAFALLCCACASLRIQQVPTISLRKFHYYYLYSHSLRSINKNIHPQHKKQKLTVADWAWFLRCRSFPLFTHLIFIIDHHEQYIIHATSYSIDGSVNLFSFYARSRCGNKMSALITSIV